VAIHKNEADENIERKHPVAELKEEKELGGGRSKRKVASTLSLENSGKEVVSN